MSTFSSISQGYNFFKSEDNDMKSLSIVVALLLTAAMNLAYSGDALDGVERESGSPEIQKSKAQDCPLVCTRPGTSLHPEECRCSVKDGTKPSMNDNSMHYIGSKITKNGSEITIYKDKNGHFIAIQPDNAPPNHYKKSKTLKGLFEFGKVAKKEGGANHYEKDDQLLRKKMPVKTPNTKMLSGNTTKLAQKNDVARKKTPVKTPNTKMLSGNTTKLAQKNDVAREKTLVKTPNTKMLSGNTIKLVQRNGVDKVYATVSKKGTGKIIKIYKALDNDWIASDKDGNKVRYGSRNSLKHIVYEKEQHEGLISKADKYQIELDEWKRSEAARKSQGIAQKAARNGGDDRILRGKTPVKTPNINIAPVNTIKLVQRNGVDKVYATVTKRVTGKIVKIYKALDNDWIASDEDGNKVRYGSRNSLKHIFYEKEQHEGLISKADKYQIELDEWKRSEATRKSREAAQERAER